VIQGANATECHLSSGQCPASVAGGSSEHPGRQLELSNEQQSTLIQLGHGDPGDPAQVTEESAMHLRPQYLLQEPGTSAAPAGSIAATTKAAAAASPAEHSASLNVGEAKPQLLSQPPLQQMGRLMPPAQTAATSPSMERPKKRENAATDFAESNATTVMEDNATSMGSKVIRRQVLSVPLESSSGSQLEGMDLLQQPRLKENVSTDDFPAENNRGLFVAVLPVQVETGPVLDLAVPPLVTAIQTAVSDLKQRDMYAYIGPLIFGTLFVCSLVFYVMASCRTQNGARPTQSNLTTEVPARPLASKILLGTPIRRSQTNLCTLPSVTTLGNPLSQKNLQGFDGNLPSLCSELVVPEENECSLLLPRDFPQACELSGQVSIDDVKEMSVFHAVYYLSGYQRVDEALPRATAQRRRLILRSAVDDLTFAYCCDAPPEPGSSHPGYTIYDHEDQAFGTLRPAGLTDQLGFRVRGRGDYQVAFVGDMQVGNVNATDEQGRLLAISEAIDASVRCVRIGPQVDAGFMTLTMLAIDLLRYDMRTSRRTSLSSPQNCLHAG